MKYQINSTTVERGAKRAASDELGGEAKKVLIDHHSHEKQASSIVTKSFAQPKFVSAAMMASSTRKNVQIIPEMSDDELLAAAIEFEKKNPQ
jgi:nanoRNase/pAp phosphatase (c-di-AMP/oligoRNAs hydrolase)